MKNLFIVLICCACTVLICLGKAAAQGALVNGDFEFPELPQNSAKDVDPDGWVRLGSNQGGIFWLFNGNGGIAGTPTPRSGNQQYALGYSGSGISQRVTIAESGFFRLSWWTATDSVESSVPMTYYVRVWNMEDSSLVASNQFAAQLGYDWTQASIQIDLQPGLYNLEFRTAPFFNGSAIFLDDVSMTQVPEPGTFFLSGLGVLFVIASQGKIHRNH